MMIADKREYMRQYRLDHPDRMLNYARRSSANKRAREYGAPGEITVAEIEAIIAAGQCFYCGSTKKLGLDHVIPLHAGGPNRPENIVCACHFCNQSKRRTDRPGRWSQIVDSCQRCGTSERRHWCKGMCRRCYRAVNFVPNPRVYVTAPPNLQCERCGKPFHLNPAAIKKGRGRYCSRPCRWTVESRAVVGRPS